MIFLLKKILTEITSCPSIILYNFIGVVQQRYLNATQSSLVDLKCANFRRKMAKKYITLYFKQVYQRYRIQLVIIDILCTYQCDAPLPPVRD